LPTLLILAALLSGGAREHAASPVAQPHLTCAASPVTQLKIGMPGWPDAADVVLKCMDVPGLAEVASRLDQPDVTASAN
jgi:hypothetical protein